MQKTKVKTMKQYTLYTYFELNLFEIINSIKVYQQNPWIEPNSKEVFCSIRNTIKTIDFISKMY